MARVGLEVRINELVHRIHRPVDGPAPYAHWFETPDSLYIIANAFNLCVILIAQLGSTTVLPLYSYSDRPEATLELYVFDTSFIRSMDSSSFQMGQQLGRFILA
ncbi:hypothetical protein M9H77_28019 [Catharanthus roseus]|uniref:Uncharacterized protein n=1 Tax=Catharanthus roseus TaxID=4058 RepID=A0ACC0AF64_CATRO|nr:hypothetical protein M9H77_28019 [Catharanthus roseus]